MSGRIIHQLAWPYSVNRFVDDDVVQVDVRELSLAPRIKGRHMRATDNARGPAEARLHLISSLAGIPREEADELDEVDLVALDALYGGEQSDLQRVSLALGLTANAPIDAILAAIVALKTSPAQDAPRDVPLGQGLASGTEATRSTGGVASSAAGQGTGERSLAI